MFFSMVKMLSMRAPLQGSPYPVNADKGWGYLQFILFCPIKMTKRQVVFIQRGHHLTLPHQTANANRNLAHAPAGFPHHESVLRRLHGACAVNTADEGFALDSRQIQVVNRGLRFLFLAVAIE